MASEDPSLPRLLVVTDFSPAPISGGALLRQMLDGYPKERLHWWTCASDHGGRDYLVPELLHPFPVPRRIRPFRRWVGLKGRLVESCWVPFAARHLRQTITAQRIEALWIHLSDWVIPVARRAGVTRLAHSLVSIWDYQNSQVHRQQYTAPRAHRFARWAESLYAEAGACAVISEPMRDDLAVRTGRRDAVVFHSGLEPWQMSQLSTTPSPASGEIRVAYAGSILAPETFSLFIRALDQVRRSLTRPVRLHLFSQTYRHHPWFDPEWMRDHGFLGEKEFYTRLRECTWGFCPMNLRDDDDPAYRRYSFPNKFGTYLSAGLPLIVLAHRDSSAAGMFHRHPVGLYSDSQDPATLRALLEEALSASNPLERHREAILCCVRDEFDASRMRRELWACLRLGSR